MSRFKKNNIIQYSDDEDDDSIQLVDESADMSVNSSKAIESSSDEDEEETSRLDESANMSVASIKDVPKKRYNPSNNQSLDDSMTGDEDKKESSHEISSDEDEEEISRHLDGSSNTSVGSVKDVSKKQFDSQSLDDSMTGDQGKRKESEFANMSVVSADSTLDTSTDASEIIERTFNDSGNQDKLKEVPRQFKSVNMSEASVEDYEESEEDEDGSISGNNQPRSQIIESPPKILPEPLARSSILPVIKTNFTTRFLPIPKAMLNQSQKVEENVVVLDDSDVIAEDSDTENKKQNNSDVMVIEESNSSSSSASTRKTSSFKNSSAASASIESAKNMQQSTESTNSSTDSQSEIRRLKQQIKDKELVLRSLEYAHKNCDPKKLKDGGELLRKKMECCRLELFALKQRYKETAEDDNDIQILGSVKQDIILSAKDQKTAHLGQKGLQTHRIEKALTMDALVSLHSSLASTPGVDAMETDPKGLKVELMSHQRQALAWLLHREKQSPAGGILADDMGLGKTLTMIALVMRSEELQGQNDENEKPAWMRPSSDKKHSGKTLVVCPASLIGQWESQVRQHVRGTRLTTLLHHGTNREGRGSKLTGADIVITTYGVLAQDNKDKVALFRVAWERVILDEAHQIRNYKTQAAIAACELEAKYRWCLTGTPVHNKELDIYSLLKFLRCSPFDDLMVWKRWVDNKTAAGTERLNTVVKSILLRRTKEELKSQGKLTDLSAKQVHNVRVELDEQEFRVYEHVLKFSQTLVARYLQERAEKVDGGLMAPRIQQLQGMMQNVQDIKTHDILVLLLRLRQICCLPGLISAMLEEDDTALTDGFEKQDPEIESLFKQVRRLTISAPIPKEERPPIDLDKVLMTSNPVFNIQRPSSKMKAVLGTLKEILETGEKVVVVSQWSSFLKHLAGHLNSLGFKIATLDGSIPVKARGPLVEEFNDPKSKLRLLLLSLTAGGVGLNLIGGNHLIIMEPHWNPQLESQACDRVYRVGQKKPVHIYKIICKETIEEQIEQLQQKKLTMAENVLTGQLKKELTKLSLQDLKSLFGLEPI